MCEVISRSPSPYGSDSDEVWDILMSDSSVSEETPLLKKPRHSGRTRVYLAACTVYLANFSFGAALGYPSPALPDIRKRIPLSDSSNDWFGAFSSISAIIGGLAGGQLVGIAGRRGTILLSSLGSVLGFLLIEVTPIIGVIFAGRALTGFSMGIIATSTPTFIGEISPQNIRGALVSLSALSTSFGIMFVYTLGKWLDYQWLAVACMAPAVVMAVIMPWVAESPRWLMQIGRTEEAKKAFQFYRDSEEDGDFEALYVNAIHTTKVSLRHLRRPHVWKPILYTTIGSTLQPLSGIVVVLSYAHDIFQAAGSTIGPVDCAIIMGAVRIPSMLLSSFLLDRCGRKAIMLISILVTCISLITMGAFYNLKATLGPAFVSAYGWLPLTVMCIYMCGYCLGLGSLPLILVGEMLPLSTKGIGAGLAVASNFAGGAITAREYHSMINLLGNAGIFWFYGAIMAIGFLFVLFFLPETRGRTLEEIEALLGKQGEVCIVNGETPAVWA